MTHRWLVGTGVMLALAAALALIVAGGGASLAEDVIIYVDADAPAPGNGEDWTTAYPDLQDALADAEAGQQIWVAAGTYTPTWQFDTEDPRSATFQMANGVAIYGGFAGGETELGQRNWDVNETILSGDLNGDDGPDFANRGDNAYHVFYHPEALALDSTAVLDGFTISGGNANSYPHNSGGGMFNDYSSPTLANLTFTGNEASYGGGMANWYSSPTLVNLNFTGNSANYGCGGGMYNAYSSPNLTNCTFTGNSATFGGGFFNYSSSPNLTNSTFTSNSATRHGGGMANESSSPALTNCTFLGNQATEFGGGMYNWGSSPTLANCTFSGNSAGQLGGGMGNYSSSPNLLNCILWGDEGEEIYNLDTGSIPVVTYSNIQGGYDGEGNINADPLFLDVASGNLRLQLNSPAIDGGDNGAVPAAITTDLGGNPRFADVPSVPDTGSGDPPIVDMGAYEAPPDVIYVDRDAPGEGDGTSWLNAFTNLQDGLDAATAPAQIWVAAGVYTPTWQFDGDPRSATFQMANGVILYGGFDPDAGDDAWEERDWVLNETILSGDLNGDDGPEFANNGENSYHVFYNPGGLDSTAILDGFIITGGNANGTDPHRRGGGMRNESSSPTLTNCTFSGNSALVDGGGLYNKNGSSPVVTGCTFSGNSAEWGAGMYNRDSSPVVTGCTFEGNSSEKGGGGVLNSNSSPTLTNCTFTDNSAEEGGGGVLNSNSSPTLTNCTFTANSASSGGGMYNSDSSSPTLTGCTFSGNSATSGGGMFNSSSSPTLTNCTFTGNSSLVDGGAMYNSDSSSPTLTGCTFSGNYAYWGGGGMLNSSSSPTLTNCTFSGNSAANGSGGGMSNSSSSPTLTNCTFTGNSSLVDGGGMYNLDSSPVVTGCTFSGNSASSGGGMYNHDYSSPTLTGCTFTANSADSGGGMYNYLYSSPTLTNCTFTGNSANDWGGGIYIYSSSPVLTNCTFYGNSATDGGGIYNYISWPTLTNCILWGDTAGEIYAVNSSPVVTYSDIQGEGIYPGTGNINADPLFADPDNGDFHLGPGSPCIDAGTNDALYLPEYDFEGDPRIMDGNGDGDPVVDMGVDEAWARVYLPLVLRAY